MDRLPKDTNGGGTKTRPAFPKPLGLGEVLGVLVQMNAAPLSATEVPQHLQPEVPQSTQPRVMVVEDNEDHRVLLAEYLRKKGFETFEANCGEESLGHIPEFRPHIVLLDIMMPGMNGVETLRRIKTLAKDTCVVMVSAIEDTETARQTLAVGASDYVPKPVDFQYLDSVLRTHLVMFQV